MIRNALLLCLASMPLCPLHAESGSDLKWGIEAVTGIRSGYVHRGYDLADTSLEFQLQAEYALSNESLLNFGLWHLAESTDDFSGSSAYLELEHQIGEQLWIGGSITYLDLEKSMLNSGWDFGASLRYRFHDDWDLTGALHYDFATDGWYSEAELAWSRPLSKSAFLSLDTGISAVSNYYGDSGFHDIFGRLALTYALSDHIAFTPFLGGSIQLDDSHRDDEVYAGLWFEVIF